MKPNHRRQPVRSSNLALAMAAACLAFFAATAQADWLNFRGPGGCGFVEAQPALPTSFAEADIRWKSPLPGRGLSSPIVVGDRVFLTCSDGPEQKRLVVLCLNDEDGSIIWRREFWATGRTMVHKKTSVAAPTPASDGKRIYASFSSNDVVCLDLDGNLIWLRGLTYDYPNASNSLGMASSLIIAGDTLVCQVENDSESFVVGLDLDNGLNRWKSDRPKEANWTSPTLMRFEGKDVVILQSKEGVSGVDPSTGSEVWHYPEGASVVPSAASANGVIYVPSNGLTALAPSSSGGEVKSIWQESALRPGTASPLVVGNRVFTINGAGVLSAADIESGETRWRMRLKGPFSASPVASGDHLFIFNEDGVGQCVDLSGERGKVIGEIELGETILGTAAIDGGAVYVRSDGHVWKFGGMIGSPSDL